MGPEDPVVEQADFVVERLGRRALRELQPENAERPRFIRDKVNQTAVLPPEFLRGLADFAAQNHLAFVKLIGQPRQRLLIREGQQHDQIRLRAHFGQTSGQRRFHVLHLQTFAQVVAQTARIEHPDDGHAKTAALEDAVGIKNRFAVGLVPQIGAEHRDGRGAI